MGTYYTTYRHEVYSIMDKLRLIGRDKDFEDSHIIKEINDIRGLLLKQKYSDVRKSVDSDNYQSVKFQLEPIEILGTSTLTIRSTEKCPSLLGIIPNPNYVGNALLNNIIFNVQFVSDYEFVFTGYNKWLSNIIYATILADGYLYLKSVNPQIKYFKECSLFGLFEDPIQVSLLETDITVNNELSELDFPFPLERGLVAQLEDMVIQRLVGPIHSPTDKINNANNELSEIPISSK